MTGVKLREGESFEEMLRRFKKILNRDKIMDEVKRLEHYEKPSERRKKELATARRRVLRRLKQIQEKLKK
ncbi:MAG: 30S ribosomal protein S21 [candidate division WOR-3 bacterium]